MKEMIEPELFMILEQGVQQEKWKVYEEYKGSDNEWLEKIPTHWHNTVIKRYLSSLKDGTHGTFQRLSEGIPLLSAKNVDKGNVQISDCESVISQSDYHSINKNGYLKIGDLLLTIVGTIGRTAIFELLQPVAFQRSVAVLRLRNGHFVRYFYYLLQSCYVQTYLLSKTKQSAQSGVYLNDVALLPVLIPPRSEQQAIVAFLDRETTKINDLIAKKERMTELLQERRTAIINRAITKGLNPDVPMKDSGVEWLGEIPRHWEVRRLKYIADVLPGVAKGRNLNERKVIDLPYLRVANVQDGHLELSDVHTITVGIDEVERFSLKLGDVLMNEGGDFDKLGRGFIWDDSIKPCLHQNHVFAVRPFRVAESVWINIITQTSYAKHYFILKSKQSTNLASISKSNIQDLPIIIPPAEEMEDILTYISNGTAKIDKLVSVIEEAIKKLKEYNTALISAAVTGKIDVRGEVAEIQAIEETAL